MKNSFNDIEINLSQQKIEYFKKMLGYLNQDKSIEAINHGRGMDDIPAQIQKTLLLMQEIQYRMDNPDEMLYKTSQASEIAKEFGLAVDPVYYGKGISVVDGKNFVDFLSSLSVDDLKDSEFKSGIAEILKQIKFLYGYDLKKNLHNNRFDYFDELVRYRGFIEKQYKRLGMKQHLENFTLRYYVDAYQKGYLKAFLGWKKLGFYSPENLLESTTTDSFLNLDHHKKHMDSYLDQVYTWATNEIGHKKSYPLVKHILSLYMQTVDEDRDYFGFSDDKVKEILRKIKEIFSKL